MKKKDKRIRMGRKHQQVLVRISLYNLKKMVSENEKMLVKNINDTLLKKAERTEKKQKIL